MRETRLVLSRVFEATIWGLVLVAIISFVAVCAAEVIPVDRAGHCTTQFPAGHLVKSIVDSAVDACIVNIGSDLVERGVLQSDAGHRGIR